MILRLNVFISSTSDLSLERDAVKQALDKLEIDRKETGTLVQREKVLDTR